MSTSEEMLESLRNILGEGAVESTLSHLSEENQWKTNAPAAHTQRKEKHLPPLPGEKKGAIKVSTEKEFGAGHMLKV